MKHRLSLCIAVLPALLGLAAIFLCLRSYWTTDSWIFFGRSVDTSFVTGRKGGLISEQGRLTFWLWSTTAQLRSPADTARLDPPDSPDHFAHVTERTADYPTITWWDKTWLRSIGFLYRNDLQNFSIAVDNRHTRPSSIEMELGLWSLTDPALPVHRRIIEVGIPTPLLALLLIAWPAWHLYRAATRRRHRRQGLCPTCSYDLRAHHPGQKCPECGTPIPQPPPHA